MMFLTLLLLLQAPEEWLKEHIPPNKKVSFYLFFFFFWGGGVLHPHLGRDLPLGSKMDPNLYNTKNFTGGDTFLDQGYNGPSSEVDKTCL